MKRYVTIFAVTFVVSLLLMLGLLYVFGYFGTDLDIRVTTVEPHSDPAVPPSSAAGIDDSPEPTVEDRRFINDDIINIAAFGLNDGLADTIMLFSYNRASNELNILSIPRDTYHHVEGHNEGWEKKINAVYGHRGDGGVLGMKRELSNLLGIPIHYYLKVEFRSVIAIVDTLGGYDVYVPYHMTYDDPYDTPPLHIDIPKGQQHLDGVETLKFLRFRKNNEGTIQEGDLVRIPRQQAFVSTMINKALDGRLLAVINTMVSGKYVGTDMTLDEMIALASKASTMNKEQQHMFTLPGQPKYVNKLSYFIHDEEETEHMMLRFYGHEFAQNDTKPEETTAPPP